MRRFAAVSLAMLANACVLVPNPDYFALEGEGFDRGEIRGETGGEDTEGEDTEGFEGTEGDTKGGGLCGGCGSDTGGSGGEESSTGGEESSGSGGHSSPWLCEEVEIPLFTPSQGQVGDVYVEIEADALVVTVLADEPWTLDKVHIYAGRDTPSHALGHYPKNVNIDRDTLVVSFALEDLGTECGAPLYVAVFADLQGEGSDGSAYQSGAWALGPGSFEFNQSWGGYFAANVCCE